MDEIHSVTGTITLLDGSTSQFEFTQGGWEQFDASTDRLARTIPAVEEMFDALVQNDMMSVD